MEFSVRKEGVMKYTAKFVLQKNSKYLLSYCIKYRIVLYYNNIKYIYICDSEFFLQSIFSGWIYIIFKIQSWNIIISLYFNDIFIILYNIINIKLYSQSIFVS